MATSTDRDRASLYPIVQTVPLNKIQSYAAASAGDTSAEAHAGVAFAPIEAVAAGMRDGNFIVELVKIVCLWVARGIMAPVEIFLRFNIGERYYNGYAALSIIGCYVAMWQLIGFPKSYCDIIFPPFLFMYLMNCVEWFQRDRKGEYWHSYSEGESRFRIPYFDRCFAKKRFTFHLSKLLFEPILTGLAGLACLAIPSKRVDYVFGSSDLNPLSIYLFAAGAVLFLYQLYCFHHRRNLLLDEKDNMLIAECRQRLTEPMEPGLRDYKGVSYVAIRRE